MGWHLPCGKQSGQALLENLERVVILLDVAWPLLLLLRPRCCPLPRPPLLRGCWLRLLRPRPLPPP